ncbi:Ubiquitin C-terminal hydrolase 12 [Linum perenne]
MKNSEPKGTSDYCWLQSDVVDPLLNQVEARMLAAPDNPNCPPVRFSAEELREFQRPWKKALIVKVLGHRFPLTDIRSRLNSLWAKQGRIQVSDISNSFFAVRFTSQADYDCVLVKGPWMMHHYYLTVQRWQPFFNPNLENVWKTLTWVRLPDLPLEFFNEEAVLRIGNLVGSVVRVDLPKQEGAPGKYARVCVEVDLYKPPLEKYSLLDRTMRIECEEPHLLCSFTCGRYEEQKSETCASRVLVSLDEAHLYTNIKVSCSEDLIEQIGKDVYFDLVDHDNVASFRILKQTPFILFKEEVAKEFGVPVKCQRFWLWAKRQNHTYRPSRPLTPQEEAQHDMLPTVPPDRAKNDILLFFKLYDPSKEELRYVGSLFVKRSGLPMEILSKLNEMAGFASDQEIDLYEEIKFEPQVMCEPIDKKISFCSSQLGDGDIVCFQKPHPGSGEQCRYPDVPSFLEYVHNRQVVRFRSLEKPKQDEFSLELSMLHTYDDVVERVAGHLGLDEPSKIRLTSHNCYSQQPRPQPIKYQGLDHLSDMLVYYNQTSDILYYEVLDIPLPELQGLKTLKVALHHASKKKVELSHPSAELRLLEVFYNKIYKVLIFPFTYLL